MLRTLSTLVVLLIIFSCSSTSPLSTSPTMMSTHSGRRAAEMARKLKEIRNLNKKTIRGNISNRTTTKSGGRMKLRQPDSWRWPPMPSM